MGFTNLVQYSGNQKILDCANINFGGQTRYTAAYGYIIGYNYLGDAVLPPGPYFWHSPKKLSEAGTNVILADANHWGTDGFKIAPHSKRGGVIETVAGKPTSFTRTLPGVTARDIGAEGGNVGYLDGSVIWKPIAKMATNRAFSSTFYLGNW